MALPTFDNANSAQANGTAVITIPAFLVGGSDRLIFVGVGSSEGTPQLTTSVVRNGSESFTEKWDAAAPSPAVNLHHSGHYFVNPAGGSFSIVVTVGATQDELAAGAISLNGVDQSTPTGTHGVAQGTASPGTVTVTAAADELLVDNFYTWSGDGLVNFGADQTPRWTQEGISGVVGGGGSTQPGTANDVMSWTINVGVQWVIGAVPIRGVSGPVVDPVGFRMPAIHPGRSLLNVARFFQSARSYEIPADAGVSAALTGEEGLGSFGLLAASVVLALSGVAGTGNVGTLNPQVSVAISGNAASGTVGSFAPSASLAISGNAATGSPGTLAATVAVPISGEQGTGSVGTLIPSSGITSFLTGNAGTGAAGSLSPSAVTALAGNAGTGSPGSLAASVSSALSGNQAAGAPGSLAASVSKALAGNVGTGSVGTLVPTSGVAVAVTGNGATGSPGSLAASVSRALSGSAGTGSVGSLGTNVGFNVALSGNAATGSHGTLSASIKVALSGVEAIGSPGTFSTAAPYLFPDEEEPVSGTQWDAVTGSTPWAVVSGSVTWAAVSGTGWSDIEEGGA